MSLRLSQLVRRDLDVDPVITGVTADSRKVKPGYLFAALSGTKVDGASFIPGALKAGAAAVLAADPVVDLAVPVVHAQDLRRAYALSAAAFWGAQPKTCVAVTGTNGKTSVATFCRQIFARVGKPAASMGTLGLRVSRPGLADEQITPPGLTTPDAADVAELLAKLAAEGVDHLALEASSHGIDQRRLDGVNLTAAGFLNFTQDHLDYHHSMEAYRAAKLELFTRLAPRGATAVMNADSDAYAFFAAGAVSSGLSILSVGAMGEGICLTGRELLPDGQRLSLKHQGRSYSVHLPLAGAFQAGNALVAAGLCIAAGEDPAAVFAALEHIEGAPGRLQRVGAGPRGGEAYVDYAHTPDGLQTVLEALRPHVRGKLIVVFGAGGDRDAGKRPKMGAIAEALSDVAIVTDDNPRSEDPAAIRAAILKAAPGAREIGDRHQAILTGAQMLNDGDVLVVAGKGHEQGQLVAGVNHPFDDVSETARALGLEVPMSEPLWTAADIAEATGGTLSDAFEANGVSIDTRSIGAGDLFVALGGARDGHEFVSQALAAGATGALVSQAVSGPSVRVADTLRALEQLGQAARVRAPQARRAAVTGSVGKTSVTQAVAAGLALAGRSHNSVKSYNNHIGVPLTLARMPQDTERAVFEIGMNHADEIAPLSRMVRPHAVAITTVGPVHTENFPDGVAGVARAKAEIFAGLQPGGLAVLNADSEWFDFLKAEAEAAGARVVSFGEAETADARLVQFKVGGADKGALIDAVIHGRPVTFPIRQTGAHWGPNSLCVLLLLEALDVTRETALAALAGFAPLAGRGAEIAVPVEGGAFTLIDESYNANPISMAAALKTLGARRTDGRRIVVLTDMLELGPDSAAFHAGLAAPIEAADADLVFLAGPQMNSLWNLLPATRRGGYADSAAQLAPQVTAAVRAGDLIMVKGSNGSRAGLIAAALAALGADGESA